MSDEISSAFTLLGTGMLTVFTVLLLVVLTGNLLISVGNALYQQGNTTSGKEASDLNRAKVAAISAAVEVVTQGKGRVTAIENIKPNQK